MKISLNLKNPKVRNPLIVIVITAVIALFWQQYFYTPSMDTLKSLQKKQKEKQDTLRTILALKPQLDVLKAELAKSQVKLDSLKSIFPDHKEIPKLLREINAVARASGIITTRFNPLPDVEREYYMENRYNVTIEGGYHELAEFFAFLANFSLIINLTSVKIVASPLNSAQTQNELIETTGLTVVSSFEMTTFSSKR
jgi:type IV pilus assembly protein PilO